MLVNNDSTQRTVLMPVVAKNAVKKHHKKCKKDKKMVATRQGTPEEIEAQ